jgi:hypothetical protein
MALAVLEALVGMLVTPVQLVTLVTRVLTAQVGLEVPVGMLVTQVTLVLQVTLGVAAVEAAAQAVLAML